MEKRLFVILLVMALLIWGTIKSCGQSFYANRYDKGRVTQLNNKTIAQKKLTVYNKRSLLYKLRRNSSYNKKRKAWKN